MATIYLAEDLKHDRMVSGWRRRSTE